MFREFPGQPYYPNNPQQNPFQYAAQQTVDFYGNLGYPKPDYPVLMQQQYYDNYQYNKMFSSQVFTPHVQPIFIAGPIYKNSPIFYGPQYLSQSLFQPVEKKRSYNYSKPDEIIESYDSNHLTSKQQIEENIRIRNQVLDQWNFKEEQKLKTQNQNKTETKRQSQESIHSQESIKSQKIIEKKNKIPEKKQNQISFKSLPKIDEEQQQVKKEKQQISTQKRKKRGRKNLRVMLQALTFIVMYFFRMKNTLLKRKKLQMNKQNSQESVNKAIAEGADWVLTFLEKELLEFWNKKEPLNWLENDQLSDKEKRNRINKVKQFIDKITVTLNEQIKSTSFPKYFQEFLAQITQNYQFVPDQYLFNFELIRLQFNSFSALKNMGTQQKKMNIAFLLMIRILAFTILYTPWTLGLTNITKTKILESNSLIVVSVLQELVIFDFREIPANENNQNHLSIDVKVNPRPQGPLQAIPDTKVQQQKQHLKNLQEPLIYPTYNKEEMKDLFDEQTEWVNGILDTLDEINSKIVYIIDNWHKKNKVKITDGLKRNR